MSEPWCRIYLVVMDQLTNFLARREELTKFEHAWNNTSTWISFSLLHSLPCIPTPEFVGCLAVSVLDFMPFKDGNSQGGSKTRNVENETKVDRWGGPDMRRREHGDDRDTVSDESQVNKIYLAAQVRNRRIECDVGSHRS